MLSETYRNRPDWARRLNYLGPATGSARNAIPIDADDLLATDSNGYGDTFRRGPLR